MKNTNSENTFLTAAQWVRAYVDALVSPQGPANASAAVAYARAVACSQARNVCERPAQRRPVACGCR